MATATVRWGERIDARVTEEQRRELERLAAEAQTSVSTLIRQALMTFIEGHAEQREGVEAHG